MEISEVVNLNNATVSEWAAAIVDVLAKAPDSEKVGVVTEMLCAFSHKQCGVRIIPDAEGAL